MTKLIKSVLHILFNDYQLNRIYFVDLPHSHMSVSDTLSSGVVIKTIESREQFASATDQRIQDHAWYLDEHAHAYGLFAGDELLCICCYWKAGHPQMPDRFSMLNEREAVMVDILTASQCRGKGYAFSVMRYAENNLFHEGYNRLWTWVWHSNVPSIGMFNKAGWNYKYFLTEFKLYGMKNYVRFRLPPWTVL